MSDLAHITELYRRYGPVVYRRCLKLLANPDDAADATQSVFIKLLRHQRRFEDIDEALPWIFEVATNHCFNLKRDSRRWREQLERAGEYVSEPATEDPTEQLISQQAANTLLAQTDEKTREVAMRVLVDEHEHQQVAQSLGVSSKTVQRTLRRFAEQAKKLINRSR